MMIKTSKETSDTKSMIIIGKLLSALCIDIKQKKWIENFKWNHLCRCSNRIATPYK